MLTRLYARSRARRLILALGWGFIWYALLVTLVSALWPTPPFIPHTLLGQLVIDLWMVLTGHIDYGTVLPCMLHGHGVNACFDY